MCAQEWLTANSYGKEVEYPWSWRMSQCSQLINHEVSREGNVYLFWEKGCNWGKIQMIVLKSWLKNGNKVMFIVRSLGHFWCEQFYNFCCIPTTYKRHVSHLIS